MRPFRTRLFSYDFLAILRARQAEPQQKSGRSDLESVSRTASKALDSLESVRVPRLTRMRFGG